MLNSNGGSQRGLRLGSIFIAGTNLFAVQGKYEAHDIESFEPRSRREEGLL